MNYFGKEIYLGKLGDYNLAIMKSYGDFSEKMEGQEFTVNDFAEWVLKDTTNEKLFDVGLTTDDEKKVVKKLGVFLGKLVKKKALDPLVKKPRRGNPQRYVILSNHFLYDKSLRKFKEGYKRKQKESKQKKLIDRPKAKKHTMENILNFNEMDLAFIGYTIRTEMDILHRQNVNYQAENEKLRNENKVLKTETNVTAYRNTIESLEWQLNEKVKKHTEAMRQEQETIKKLNQQVTSMNAKIAELKGEISRLNRLLDIEESKRSGFKVSEIAFPNKRPAHLGGK